MNIAYWRCYYGDSVKYSRVIYHRGTSQIYRGQRFFGEGCDWYEDVLISEVPYLNETIFIL